jgi:mediator of replication checkpoint protein 1
LAFQAPTTGTTSGGFKVPSLLRRATTNLSTTSTTSTGTTTPTTTPTKGGVRRGGSKKSNIHYQAREAERKKLVDASEQRRKERVKKTVLGTGRQSVLGSLGGAKFSGFD